MGRRLAYTYHSSLPGQMAKRSEISSDAVQAKTGKSWNEWYAVLDKAGGEKLDHRDIAKLLLAEHKLSPWWSQMVTVSYERARGRREIHQTKNGYVASITRTMNVSREELWKWLEEPELKKWISGKYEMTSSNKPKSVWLKLEDGSRVEFGVIDKGKKCSISAQHSKLKDPSEVAENKERWSAALARLKSLAEA